MTLEERLKMIREGALEDIVDGDDINDVDIGDGDSLADLLGGDISVDDDILSEVTLAIIESEIGPAKMQEFITENAQMLVRDKLLTEDAVGKSYIVLSPQARRQRATNILKLRMARDAGDPRYKKIIIARKLVKSLLEKIREDGRYKKAEQIIRKMKFKLVQNPEAAAALRKAGAVKLQTV